MDKMKGCIGVPAAALAIQGDGEESVMPEVGDEVEVAVMGKVESSGDGTVYVRPMTANGEPVVSEAEEKIPKEKTDSEEEEDLYRMAEEADGNAMI